MFPNFRVTKLLLYYACLTRRQIGPDRIWPAFFPQNVHIPFARYGSVILCTHGMYQPGLCFDPLGKGIYFENLATFQLTLAYTQPGNCLPSLNRTGLFQPHQHIQIPITMVALRFDTNDLTAFLTEAFVINLLAWAIVQTFATPYGPSHHHTQSYIVYIRWTTVANTILYVQC